MSYRPVQPGHVLLIPTRIVKKYAELSETEAMEFMISSKKIGENLKSFYQVDSIQYTIQDGEDAGILMFYIYGKQ